MNQNNVKNGTNIITKKKVKESKLKTLNNLLCLVNTEIGKVKSLNDKKHISQSKVGEHFAIKKDAIQNIHVLISSFNTLSDGEL